MTEQEELKQLADECFSEATKYLHDSKYRLALDTALRAKEIYSEINERRKEASISNVISLIYEELGNSSLELQFQLDALEIAGSEKEYDLSAKLLNNLGSKLLFNKAYERALYYFQLAIDTSKKAEEANLFSGTGLCDFNLVISMNLATTYCHLGDLEKAEKYHKLAKEAATQSFSEDILFPYKVFEAVYLKRVGAMDKAEPLIPAIIEAVEQNTYTTDYLEVLLDVIELLQARKDFANWERVLTAMENHLESDSSIFFRMEVLNQWIIFYHESGRTAEYQNACINYYDLSTEKAKQDLEKEAGAIELSIEVRETMRQKKLSDSKIYLDSLTGIGNRNKMLADSEVLIKESYENKTSIAIGLLDIDFFKESNDTYGHIEGDGCLKQVAGIIKEALGNEGDVYRYGGDEFLILMKTGNVDKINNLGATIKEKLSEHKLHNEKSPICPYVTISQGYTSAVAERNDSIDTLVRLADRVLYSVKRNGRDGYKYLPIDKIIMDM